MTRRGYDALTSMSIGLQAFAVPGRHEAEALTDWCPRVGCMHPSRPAAVLDP